MKLPLKYTETMKALLGEEYDAYLASFDEERFYGLRVNTLKLSAEEMAARGVFSLRPVPWCETGFYYDGAERPAKHPYYHAGLYYLQEPSAMSPAATLPIEKGDRVLDLCAAPGGKTTQLGARLGGTGLLVANDISAGRAKTLLKNVELAGIRNAIVMSETPERIAERLPNFFDKILVDAPCSGEGMFRKEPDMVKSWDADMLAFCRSEQAKILEACAPMLKAGGMLLYSTVYGLRQTLSAQAEGRGTFSGTAAEEGGGRGQGDSCGKWWMDKGNGCLWGLCKGGFAGEAEGNL